MASVITRRLFMRNLPKLKEINAVRTHYNGTSVLIVRFDPNGGLFHNHSSPGLNQDRFVNNRLWSPLISSNFMREYSEKVYKPDDDDHKEEKKLSLLQRFKKMYKEYWYVLLPVHLVTSTVWFGGFYYLAKSGVDIAGLLESMHVSQRITNPLKDSSVGYLAVAYALYKIATPVRYTVTLGGTTISINYLKKWGYIKPVPSTEQLKRMYQDKKEDLIDAMRETRQGFKAKSEKFKDKKEDIMDDIDKSITNIKHLSNQIKKEHVLEEVKKDAKKGRK